MLNLSKHLVSEIPVPPMTTFKQDLMLIQLPSPCTFNILLASKPCLRTSEHHEKPKMKREGIPTYKKEKKKKTKLDCHVGT